MSKRATISENVTMWWYPLFQKVTYKRSLYRTHWGSLTMKIYRPGSLFCLSHTDDTTVTVESTNFGLLPIFLSLKTFGKRTLPLPSAPFPSLIFHVAQLLPVLQNGLSDISFLLLVFERWTALLLCHTSCKEIQAKEKEKQSVSCNFYQTIIKSAYLTVANDKFRDVVKLWNSKHLTPAVIFTIGVRHIPRDGQNFINIFFQFSFNHHLDSEKEAIAWNKNLR